MVILFVLLGALLSFGIVFLLLFLTTGIFIRRVGPNEVMIVYGAGGTKVIVGGSCVVIPRYQTAKYFSLELMSFTVDLTQEVYLAEQETYVKAKAVVLIKVRTSEPNIASDIERILSKGQPTHDELLRSMNENTIQRSILKAVELFLDKSQAERNELIRTVIEGHLHGILGQHTFDELVQMPEEIVKAMFKATAPDLDRMGLEMVSFTMKDLHRLIPEQSSEI